jgi:hypothetical protein
LGWVATRSCSRVEISCQNSDRGVSGVSFNYGKQMMKLAPNQKTALWLLPVSLLALWWLLSFPERSRDLLPRLGFCCAFISVAGMLTFCWASCVAYVARERNWSPLFTTCVGWLSLFPVVFIVIVSSGRTWFWGKTGILAALVTCTGTACRRMAFPDLTDEEFAAPAPPPTLLLK